MADIVAEVERLRALLREVEWVPDDEDVRLCPMCHGIHPDDLLHPRAVWWMSEPPERAGHAPNCRIAAALK